MARLLTVTEQTAEAEQCVLIEKLKRQYGVLLGVQQLLLADLSIGLPSRQLYERLNLRPDSPFTRLQRELLATLVYGLISQVSCSCLGMHTEAVRRLTHDERFGPDFVHAWPTAQLDAKTRALLVYAKKLTETPGRIDDEDIEALRAVGWDDQAIYEATALIAYYNMSGRMEAAAGLTPDRIPPDAPFAEAIPDGRE
jgi:uncharacterized peroxidase-related enzyme